MLGNVLLCLFDEVEDSLLCGIFAMTCSGWAGVDFSASRSKTAWGDVKRPQFIRKERGRLGWLGGGGEGLSPGEGGGGGESSSSPAGSA